MASLLSISVRPELPAADSEYAAFHRGMGAHALDRHDLLAEPLTDEIISRYRGFVVGGSPFNVTDAVRSEQQIRVERDLERLAAAAMAGTAAVMFTCYSIGVVTRMLGGTVDLAHPEPASAVELHATDAAANDPVFGPAGASYSVFTAHKESAPDTPPGATLLASADTCPVAAYRVGTHLYATQFHPEPSPGDFAERMTFYRSKGYFDPAEFDIVQQRVLASSVTEGEMLLRRFATFALSN